VDWLALVVLGIIWGILLVPGPRRRALSSPLRRERPIEQQEEFRAPGRWILSPKRGSSFLGRRARSRMRAQERRRRVFLFLLEAVALTGLIGLFPPLRGMMVITAVFVALLVAFTVLSLRAAAEERVRAAERVPDRDVVAVLPQARPEPEFELREQDRRVVRIAAR
jgi:hypothetical protein